MAESKYKHGSKERTVLVKVDWVDDKGYPREIEVTCDSLDEALSLSMTMSNYLTDHKWKPLTRGTIQSASTSTAQGGRKGDVVLVVAEELVVANKGDGEPVYWLKGHEWIETETGYQKTGRSFFKGGAPAWKEFIPELPIKEGLKPKDYGEIPNPFVVEVQLKENGNPARVVGVRPLWDGWVKEEREEEDIWEDDPFMSSSADEPPF